MPRAPEPLELRFPRSARAAGTAALLRLGPDDFVAGLGPGLDELRRRIAAWARHVAARLRDHGLELAACSVDDGAGPGVLFLGYGAGARDGRVTLLFAVDRERVRAGLELPFAQVDWVLDRLAKGEAAATFEALLDALPEQFTIGIDGEGPPVQAPRCKMAELHALLERARARCRPLWIGWWVPRALAIEHTALLDEQLEDALAALARVYLFLAGDVEGETAAGRRRRPRTKPNKGLSRGGGDREGEPPTLGPSGPAQHRRIDRPGGDGAEPRSVQSTAASTLEAFGDRADGGTPARPPTLDKRKMPVRPVFRRSAATGRGNPALSLERGVRVRVLEGAFSGQVGIVHELDGKGGARVMLGLLAVRLDVKHLSAQVDGRSRPRLPTSHRKPLPVRS